MQKMNNMLSFLRKRGVGRGRADSANTLSTEATSQILGDDLPAGHTSDTMLDWPPVFEDITQRRGDVKTLRSFMDQLGTITDAYSKGLKRIADLKLPKFNRETSLSQSWGTIKHTVLRLSRYYEDTANKINKRVMLGILECKHQIRTEQDRLQAQSSKMLSEMYSLQSKLDLRKKKYIEATDKAHNALTVEQKARAEGQSQKKHERLVRDRASRVREAKNAHDKYQIALHNLQAAQRNYVKSSANIVKQLEALEQMRVAVCVNQLKTFLNFRETAARLEEKLAQELQTAIGKIDCSKDAANFKQRLTDQFKQLKITEYSAAPHHDIVNYETKPPKTTKGTTKMMASPSISSRYYDSTDYNDSLRARSASPRFRNTKEKREVAVALHNFEPLGPDHVKISAGDRIRLTNSKEGADWWTGFVRDTKGQFPAAFVRKISDIPDNEAPMMILKMGEAIQDFDGVGENELSLKVGDNISITALGEGWYVGMKVGTGESGIFPAETVRINEHKKAVNS